MIECPKGTVSIFSFNEKRNKYFGYSSEIAKWFLQSSEKFASCIPLPCKWYFAYDGKIFFNDGNIRDRSSCICDVQLGWVPSADMQHCIPLFKQEGSEKDQHLKGDVLFDYTATSLVYVEVPQTIHTYKIFNDEHIADHLQLTLLNGNTFLSSSENFPLRHSSVLEVGEEGVQSTTRFLKNCFSLYQNDKLIKLAKTVAEANNGNFQYITNCERCEDEVLKSVKKANANIFCVNEAKQSFSINRNFAVENKIGGCIWHYSNKHLEIILLGLGDAMFRETSLKF